MKINHYISALWTAICIMVVSLTACADIEYDYPNTGGNGGDSSTKQLRINVMLPAMSRAEYQFGNTYENTINLAGNDYRLLLFTEDTNTLVCSFSPLEVQYELLNYLSFQVCTITADVAEEITAYKNLRVVMLANWRDYPILERGKTTIDDLAGYANDAVSTAKATTFDASEQLIAKEGNYIPLFGIKECKNINWLAGSIAQLGELWMLRSVAKIEVKSVNNLPPIESVELTRYNDKGTCAPRGVYSEKDYVGGTDRYKPLDYVTLPGDKNDSGLKNYKLSVQNEDDGTFVVYVPEYQILSDYSKPQQPVADRPVLNIRFQGVTETYQLEFKYLNEASASANDAEEGDYFDIVRNFIYRYNVSLTGNGLEWDVDVLPYTAVELKPNFGLLLADLTLNKYVIRLYTDSKGPTRSQDVLVAYDENNKQLTAGKVKWNYSESIVKRVCEITSNDDGTCTVKPIQGATGRDVVEALIYDKNGFEVTAECIVEVTERNLGLEKASLNIVPYNVLPAYSYRSFKVNIVAERDADSKLKWELRDSDDELLTADSGLYDLVTVSGEAAGSTIQSGDNISEKDITINVQANDQNKHGNVHLWIYYEGPDPDNLDDPSKRRIYSTYCDIVVSPVSLNVYPTVLHLTVGQRTSVSARTTPVFSDYIPNLVYESENPSVVTVDNNGLVNAVGEGLTRIKISSPDELFNWMEPRYVEVSVAPDDLVLMRYDGVTPAEHIELLSGEKVSVRAFSHGVDISDKVVWDIVDDSFVSVEKGVVTAGAKAGTSTVRATYTVGGRTYTETCIVVVATGRKLAINDYPRTVSVSASVPMKAYVFPDSVPYDSRHYDVTWTSSNTGIMAFDDEDNSSLAVAKGSGLVTLTASTVYNGTPLSSSAQIFVQGGNAGLPDVTFVLKIYDANGAYVTDINTEHADYPGWETGYNGGETDVGGLGLFDKIQIPAGETWTARVEFTPAIVNSLPTEWKQSKRFNWYDDRIDLQASEDGLSCKIRARTRTEVVSTAESRYNEVKLTFAYNGETYTRRFCVYTINF